MKLSGFHVIENLTRTDETLQKISLNIEYARKYLIVLRLAYRGLLVELVITNSCLTFGPATGPHRGYHYHHGCFMF